MNIPKAYFSHFVRSVLRLAAPVLGLALVWLNPFSANAVELRPVTWPGIEPIKKSKPLGHAQTNYNLGDGIVVRVFGRPPPRGEWWSGILIERDGKTIFKHNFKDGVIDIKYQKVSSDGSHYNIELRHGSQKNRFYALAVRGDTVIQSAQYRGKRNDILLPSHWLGPNVLVVGGGYGPSKAKILTFDTVANQWSFTPMNLIHLSHNVQIELFDRKTGFRILSRGENIFERKVKKGPITLSFLHVPGSDEQINLALRYGKYERTHVCFALIGKSIIESPSYHSKDTPSNLSCVPSEWITPNCLEMGAHREAKLTFDPATSSWNLQKKVRGQR